MGCWEGGFIFLEGTWNLFIAHPPLFLVIEQWYFTAAATSELCPWHLTQPEDDLVGSLFRKLLGTWPKSLGFWGYR